MTSHESTIRREERKVIVHEEFRWLAPIYSQTWVPDMQKNMPRTFTHLLSVAHLNSAKLAGKHCDTDQQQIHQCVFSGQTIYIHLCKANYSNRVDLPECWHAQFYLHITKFTTKLSYDTWYVEQVACRRQSLIHRDPTFPISKHLVTEKLSLRRQKPLSGARLHLPWQLLLLKEEERGTQCAIGSPQTG